LPAVALLAIGLAASLLVVVPIALLVV
jgi:hypothetical protein